jgi:hypothetical protein
MTKLGDLLHRCINALRVSLSFDANSEDLKFECYGGLLCSSLDFNLMKLKGIPDEHLSKAYSFTITMIDDRSVY